MIDALPLLLADDGYQISRSVRFRRSASAFFSRTPSASNRKTWTWSCWVKRGELINWQGLFMTGVNGTTEGKIQFEDASTGLRMRWEDYVSGTYNLALYTTQVFRDVAGWYHIVAALDTTQATASNRAKLYVNGVQITAFNTATYPSQNYDGVVNNGQAMNIGNAGSNYLDGYMADVYFIDGQALTPSSFGETDAVTGVWKPKKYVGTYGTNGFYLNFSDNSNNTASTIGKDYSGNGNNWTPNNISVTSGATYDSMLDVPTAWADGGNGRGNYCTLNPLAVQGFGGVPSYSNGNMTASGPGTANYRTLLSTMSVSSGKWYWEATITTFSTDASVGIGGPNRTVFRDYLYNGNKSDGTTNTAYGASYTTGDVIGVALDLDNGTLTFYKNGVSQGVAYNSGLLGSEWQAGGYIYNTGVQNYNFGQRPFAYTPPSGFKALNTGNLPEPTIKKGGQYMSQVLYTGTGAARSVSGFGMAPDFLWVKKRSAAENHALYDALRGAGKRLESSTTIAEDAESNGMSSFDSDGFSISGANDRVNTNGQTYVAWAWKEGATQGFDIVTFAFPASGPWTLAHNLGVAPRMVIVKSRSNSLQPWVVYHAALGNTGYVLLNATDAFASNITVWNNTTPTSSVVTMGSGFTSANYGANGVAYLFSEVAGFSKFGSYTGNGSADGPFVFCGFRPAYVMIKRTDTANDWAIHDKARIGYNVANYHLLANSSGAEFTDIPIDLLSNGFKLRGTSGTENASGGTYIYAAFAENPFKNALAR